jgi:protein CpxP
MKCARILSLAILLATISMGSAHVFAQKEPRFPPDTSAPPPVGGYRGMMDPAQQLARMTKRYNLSADQQGQIEPILIDQQRQMLLLRQDPSLALDEKKAKMNGIHSDSNSKIEAVLNDDQKKQFEQDRRGMQQPGPGSGVPPPQQ